MMRATMTVGAGLAAALLVITAIQFPTAALALNPQPEVPSKPNPESNWHKKNKKSGNSHKHLKPKCPHC